MEKFIFIQCQLLCYFFRSLYLWLEFNDQLPHSHYMSSAFFGSSLYNFLTPYEVNCMETSFSVSWPTNHLCEVSLELKEFGGTSLSLSLRNIINQKTSTDSNRLKKCDHNLLLSYYVDTEPVSSFFFHTLLKFDLDEAFRVHL